MRFLILVRSLGWYRRRLSPRRHPGLVWGLIPISSPIPPLAFDTTGELRNLGAILTALKDGMESLTGQRGNPANRAVTFNDLVNYGVLTPQALTSAGGNTPLAVIPAYFTPADPGGSSVDVPGIMMGTKCVFAVGTTGAFLVGASGYCASGGSSGHSLGSKCGSAPMIRRRRMVWRRAVTSSGCRSP